MNATTIEVVQNAYGYNIVFALQKSDGTIFDLTSATGIKLNVKYGSTKGIKFTANLTVSSTPSDGLATYSVANGDFNQGGTYNAEVEVDYGGGQQIWPNITIKVYKQIANL